MTRRQRQRRIERAQAHQAGQRRRLREALAYAEERTRTRKRGKAFFAEKMAERGYREDYGKWKRVPGLESAT
jgi:hypothetical protein